MVHWLVLSPLKCFRLFIDCRTFYVEFSCSLAPQGAALFLDVCMRCPQRTTTIIYYTVMIVTLVNYNDLRDSKSIHNLAIGNKINPWRKITEMNGVDKSTLSIMQYYSTALQTKASKNSHEVE